MSLLQKITCGVITLDLLPRIIQGMDRVQLLKS